MLVERLWPRGVSKERAGLDLWLKDVAPSPGCGDGSTTTAARWKEFQESIHRGTQGDAKRPRIC